MISVCKLKLYSLVFKVIKVCCTNVCVVLTVQAFANQKVMHVLGSSLADHCQKVCMSLCSISIIKTEDM